MKIISSEKSKYIFQRLLIKYNLSLKKPKKTE